MFVNKNENSYVVRLARGEELVGCLSDFARQNDISGAFFHGLGGAESATLGIYILDSDNQYHYKDFAGPLEIVSLNGNIARDESGELMIHCHAAISGPDMNVSGGHVKSAIIAGTCEIFIDMRTGPLNRAYDADIGLKLLNLPRSQS